MPAAPPAVNATAAALLGILHDGPRTGGQLVAEAGERFGAFFSVTRSQVYRELPALADAGLLKPGKQGARASQQYALTALGKRAFRAWLASGSGTDALRSPLVLRLLHVESLPDNERAELVQKARAADRERWAVERAAVAGATEPVQRAVAEFTVAHTRAMLKLLDAVSVACQRSA